MYIATTDSRTLTTFSSSSVMIQPTCLPGGMLGSTDDTLVAIVAGFQVTSVSLGYWCSWSVLYVRNESPNVFVAFKIA